MKTNTLNINKKLLVALLFIGALQSVVAQTFNYQAVIRDDQNEPIADQSMTVLVRIIEGSATGSVKYNEVHTVTSNAQGVITLPVGGGTSGANFLAIDWSLQNQWIDIQVDVAGGSNYTQIGTTKLNFVPYAMYAINSTTATNAGPWAYASNVVSNSNGNILTDDFVFGSTQLDANGFNSVFNVRMFFDKSKGAFRAGRSSSDEWDEENVGLYSVAFGEDALAQGSNSFAMGRNANATRIEGFAFGSNAGAFGDYSRGFGLNARAHGDYSTAIGKNLNANSYGEIQLGMHSNFVSGSPDTFVATDRLFVIGNGQPDINQALNSDALVMLKNGNTTLNGELTIDGDNAGSGTSYTLPAQDGTTDQIISTDGSGQLSWVTPASSALPNGGNGGDVLATDGNGVYSWVNNDILPSGGTDGEVLATDGSGVYSWVSVDDADADATNEIELPIGGDNGQVLATDGSGVYSWVDQPTIVTPAFSTDTNITSNANEDFAVNDFIFGAATNFTGLANTNSANRIFFDKSKAAIRIGRDIGGQNAFADVNVGAYSSGFGLNPKAAGENAFAAGFLPNASGYAAVALGNQVNATNRSAIAIGDSNTASGGFAVAIGQSSIASGNEAVTLGKGLVAEAANQTSIGKYNTTDANNNRLFVIGNGAADINGTTRSDALVMLNDGSTTLNGALTIDGDNDGMGSPYTLPAQDGTANQIMTTDGNGNVSWSNAVAGTIESPVTPTLNVGWQLFASYGAVQYYKHDGRVYLSGATIKSTNVNPGDVIFTLPVGYRPASNQIFGVHGDPGIVLIEVNVNGDVVIQNSIVSVEKWTSLNGVSFRAD